MGGCCSIKRNKTEGQGLQDIEPQEYARALTPPEDGQVAIYANEGGQAQPQAPMQTPILTITAAPTMTGYPVIYEHPAEGQGHAVTTGVATEGATGGQHGDAAGNPGGTAQEHGGSVSSAGVPAGGTNNNDTPAKKDN
ncbi:hypothetical protein FALBO_14011 [Fusarium albosuccineum]|uniref:Uncharacterized protein n=1 Tax=Fusarium albosuccineum TaxID=1237068 RepID=A0A8H4P6J8_9HYPO|nr:hypothetical protein FALBO_14011 [Fusarium albosuccineum]KAF5008521.1 hypothetical protein FDECE_5221 [Fusarium decemcellulare]